MELRNQTNVGRPEPIQGLSMNATMSGPGQYDGLGISEYTQRHRELWSILVRGRDAETLDPAQLPSWLKLWGRLGGELFECFHHGDDHVRLDMISLARGVGGWRGPFIADRLERWQRKRAC